MAIQTLSGVTLQTLDNYRNAATRAVSAYRAGGHRLVSAVSGALEHSVYPRTSKLAPTATVRLSEVNDNVSQIVVKGIDQVAERTEKAIEFGSSTAAAQVSKAAEFAAGIQGGLVGSGLQTAARLAMPGAKVALALSGKVAEGAQALAEAAGARPVRKAVRKAAAGAKRKATPVVQQARRTVKRATVKANEVAQVAKAPVAKAKRNVRAAKKAVTETVAAVAAA